MSDEIRSEVTGNIARLTIDRVSRGNMLTLDMLTEFSSLLTEHGQDPAIHVIALASEGPDFCLGRDPDSAPEHSPKTAVEMRTALAAPIIGFYQAVRNAPIPVVAAVQGRAAGFGCAAAAVCDVTIASEDARFSMPEMTHNLPPTAAISAHTDRTVRKSVAWMVYTCEEIDARRAQAGGVVSDVVPVSRLRERTEDVLKGIAGRDRTSLSTCKTYMANARLMEADMASDYASNLLALVMSSRAGR